MAPTIAARIASSEHLKTVISRTTSSVFRSLSVRDSSSSPTPLASVFALIIRGSISLSTRGLSGFPNAAAAAADRTTPRSQLVEPIFLHPRGDTLAKRQQNVILAIPTTYAGLNSGPAPGALVGIVLGSIAGFILILYIILSAFRFGAFGNRQTVVEEEVVRHHHHQTRRSRSRSRAMTEASHHSPRRERVTRQREETVVVEEHVEPSLSAEDDIVEVIEEHSPERRPPKRESTRRSGYRTVDPAELGGGNRPIRKVSRR